VFDNGDPHVIGERLEHEEAAGALGDVMHLADWTAILEIPGAEAAVAGMRRLLGELEAL